MFHFMATILHTIVLAPAMIPANIKSIYNDALYLSTFIIAVSTAYAFLKTSMQSLTGQGESVQDIVGRAILAVILAQSSWTIFMDILIPLNNDIVTGILQSFGNIDPSLAGGWTLPVVGITALIAGTMSIGGLMILALLAVAFCIGLIVATVVWCVRSAELMRLIILAPIAASFIPAGRQVVSWRWLVQEMISTIFSQSMMALMVYLAFFTITGGGTNSGTDIWNPKMVNDPNMAVINFALGVTMLFMSVHGHAVLKGMMNGQSIGSDHGAVAAGMGAMVGRSIGASFIPPGIQQAAKNFMGNAGMGEFSKAGRALNVAKQANSTLGKLENQGTMAQMAEGGSLLNTANMGNPHTRQAMANETGLSGEISAQGNADNAPAISLQRSRGDSNVDKDPAAREAKVDDMVRKQVVYAQNPYVIKAGYDTGKKRAEYARSQNNRNN